MYARGILFGKMKYELGDHSFVKCPETGLCADIDFKTKVCITLQLRNLVMWFTTYAYKHH